VAPSKLTAGLILSAIADIHNVTLTYFFIFVFITISTVNLILIVGKFVLSLHSTKL
jgi:hypothetical protein